MRRVEPSKAYRILESGPIVLVVTQDGERSNVMTMGFHMMVRHSPPLIGAIIGPWNHSYEALRSSGECVIAVPGADLARTVVDIGNCSGSEIEKFERFGLGKGTSQKVTPPLLSDCLYNIECVIHDYVLVDGYDLFILQAVAAWANDHRCERRLLHHHGDGTFTADGEHIDLRSHMTLWKQFQVKI